MLQLRHSAATSRLYLCYPACTIKARPCAHREVPRQQLLLSNVGPQGKSLALQAHRGHKVAHLKEEHSFEAGALTSPPAIAVSRQLHIYSSQGAVAAVEVLPGLTTVGQLRQQVAQLLGADSSQLAGPEGSPYQGGWFDVRLNFTAGFPGEQPLAKFIIEIWHPNMREQPQQYVAQAQRWTQLHAM
ncbi:hypothetical protein OEZ86_003254 [Tetradesmus obliquus]|nr:hypothetical protein OEZ86_003254 [Tetradesmus obliquus]